MRERGDTNPLILNPCMLDGGEWSTSRADRFNPDSNEMRPDGPQGCSAPFGEETNLWALPRIEP